ncbi:Alpha-(1,3)-fucosyltransferase C [Lamellibrachia satsuma]|nr:Alpha-(1,3)-fucosyltransferase C [Lamellibrachia satsuma]
MRIQNGYSCRRKINIGSILFILVVTSIYVAIVTEIVDVWRPKTKFNFDWTLVNWYEFASANNLSISQNNDCSWTLANAHHNATPLFPERLGKPLKIGYATKVFGVEWEYQKHLESCPELKSSCLFSANRSQYNDADVLLFHMRDSFRIPSHRPPFQKWVFGLMESPVHTFVNLDKYRWLFNLTMTYKRSADISWDYGLCTRKNETERVQKHDPARNLAAGKNHLAAWFVSNCDVQSKREGYVDELMKYIDVHKYGCGGNYSCQKSQNQRCDQMLNTTYKFYLSFENSLCEDYVTEKAYRILELDVVPVVLGHSKYSDMLPPHSFIDVHDYKSPKELAEYLKMLNENDTLYNEYFLWRKTYTCQDTRANSACRLCEFALQERHHIRTVDIKQFWSIETNCISPEQYYNHVKLR